MSWRFFGMKLVVSEEYPNPPVWIDSIFDSKGLIKPIFENKGLRQLLVAKSFVF